MELKTTGRSAGFSVIEVLIASLIFLVIAVGLLPLFTNSMRNNLDGKEATEVSNIGRSQVEDLLQIPFADPKLVIPSGKTELVTNEYWSTSSQTWKPGTPTTADPGPWLRKTRVRQFSISDLADNGTFDSPLDGSADEGQVHLKELEVTVQNARAANAFALGHGRQFTVRMLKAK